MGWRVANGEEGRSSSAAAARPRAGGGPPRRHSLFATIHYSPFTTRSPMADTVLNLRGLKCPLPALKARKALTKLSEGDRLVLECTDPLSVIDIPNLLRETGDVLEASERAQTVYVFRIRKA
jgi:tRNA 2-thiouridine synthesizing protein A